MASSYLPPLSGQEIMASRFENFRPILSTTVQDQYEDDPSKANVLGGATSGNSNVVLSLESLYHELCDTKEPRSARTKILLFHTEHPSFYDKRPLNALLLELECLYICKSLGHMSV